MEGRHWRLTPVQIILVSIFLSLALIAAGAAMVFVPDTFEDMWACLDEVRVPATFEQVGEWSQGSRGGLMAPGAPMVVRSYAAPWDEGRLCENVRELIPGLVNHGLAQDDDCGAQVEVEAGSRSRLVNIWSYMLIINVTSPERVIRGSERTCEKRRTSFKESGIYPGLGGCLVPPGYALVNMKISSKRGW